MEQPTNNTKNKDEENDFSHQPTTYNFANLQYSFTSQNPFNKALLSSFLCSPISVFALIFILLLAYNSINIFTINVPILTIENGKECTENPQKLPPSQPSLYPILEDLEEQEEENEEEKGPSSLSTIAHLTSPNSTQLSLKMMLNNPKHKRAHKTPTHAAPLIRFSRRVKEFFMNNTCELHVFMTWISSLKSFGKREKFTIESLFKSHPNACLLIVSESMDSPRGDKILRPFLSSNFRVMAVSPDYKFVFKNTLAAVWFAQLKKGNIKPGEISLGQNLSNLLRLALLYKYGGVYLDTDFIVLKGLEKLRNSIGAQNVDLKTKNWNRLNNALMVFDKKHPLLNKFIEEFALTFNGNKWGHNGPYLVSRVVKRLNGSNRVEDEITILPPTAFYPVDWAKIGGLFQRPRSEFHLKWAKAKLRQIEGESFAVHLWNRQSRKMKIENGSLIRYLMKTTCVFCSSSTTPL